MGKGYSRKELTEMFNLNKSEKGVITHKFGYIPEGTTKKLYTKKDVKEIEEMLYWKRACIGLPDFVARFGIPRDMVQIRLDIINSIPNRAKKLVAKGWRIRPDYLNELKSEYSILSELEKGAYVVSINAIRELNISSAKLKKYITIFGLEGVQLHPLHKKVYCIPVKEYKSFLVNLKRNYELPDKLIIGNRLYLSPAAADKFVGIELISFKKLKERQLVNDIVEKYSTKTLRESTFVSVDSLIEFKEVINRTISVEELMDYDNRFNELVMQRIIHGPKGVIGTFPNAYKAKFTKKVHYRIKLDDVNDFLENGINVITFRYNQANLKDPFELLDYSIDKYLEQSTLNVTIESYKGFIVSMLNGYEGGRQRDFVKKQLNNLKHMINCLEKELVDYSDLEIEMLLRTYGRDTYYLAQFVNYLFAFKNEKCNFKNTYVANRKSSRSSTKKEENVYTFDEWAKYALFAMNIDHHKEKAFVSAWYSRAWAFVIIHFVAAWRKSDFLGISGLDMFSDDEIKILSRKISSKVLDTSEAEAVISLLKDLISVTLATKNKQKFKIIVPEDMKLSFASAIVLSEYHRRARKEEKLFGRFGGRNLDEAMKSKDIKGFSSLKANRTLLSLFYSEANKEASMTAYAYELGRQLRGHKLNYRNLYSSTTAQYLYAMNNDGDIDAVAYELLRRGTFGYVFMTLAKVAGETDDLSVSDLSTVIVDIRNSYSSLGLESAASQVIRNHEMKLVIEEIYAMPIEKVKIIMKDLALGKGQAKTLHTQCLRYSLGCPYEYVKSCFGCPYNIPSTYAMRLLNDQVVNIVNQLMLLSDDDTILKLKYTKDLYKSLGVLQEFKMQFDGIDKNYLSSFIDLGRLKENLVQLQNQGKLVSLED